MTVAQKGRMETREEVLGALRPKHSTLSRPSGRGGGGVVCRPAGREVEGGGDRGVSSGGESLDN